MMRSGEVRANGSDVRETLASKACTRDCSQRAASQTVRAHGSKFERAPGLHSHTHCRLASGSPSSPFLFYVLLWPLSIQNRAQRYQSGIAIFQIDLPI